MATHGRLGRRGRSTQDAHLRAMHAQGLPVWQIARRLDEEGLRPTKRSEHFHPSSVEHLLCLLDLTRRRPRGGVALQEHEWLLADLASEIGMPVMTLRNWVYRGTVRGRRTDEAHPRLILWADPEEVERLRALRRRPPGWASQQRWLRRSPIAADQESKV